jgi:hypothetical protein
MTISINGLFVTLTISNTRGACFDCSCRRMQFHKLLKEKCFHGDLQCFVSNKTLSYEEQFFVNLPTSSLNVVKDEFRHFLDFLCRQFGRHHEIFGKFDQLMTLATYLCKLDRFISTEDILLHFGTRLCGQSKHSKQLTPRCHLRCLCHYCRRPCCYRCLCCYCRRLQRRRCPRRQIRLKENLLAILPEGKRKGICDRRRSRIW